MKITLVTACRNAAETLATTLESVRRQRLGSRERGTEHLGRGVALEYIVIDGASTDGTVNLIKEFDDEVKRKSEKGKCEDGNLFSFRWFSERDLSLYDGINKGIRMATGDVIGICNADDVLAEDDTVLKIASAFENREEGRGNGEQDGGVDAVYADIRFVRGGESVEALRSAQPTRYCTGKFFRNWMFRFATFPAHPSTFIRRACFEKYGLYSLDYRICADFELMLRFFFKNRIRARYLPICTHVMRTGGLSTGGLKSNVQINREDLRALKANGVWSWLPLIYLKYFAKIWGYVLKSR